MRFQLSPLLTVTLKHSYTRDDGQIYWQRKLPKRHLERYPSTAPLKRNLFTRDPVVAAQKIARLDREHEALWKAMDNDPALTPETAREAAKRLLKTHGIGDPRLAASALADQFFARLEEKRIAYAESQYDPEEAYHHAPDEEYLNKPEVEALRMLRGGTLFLFSDAIEVYLAEHKNAGKASFANTAAFTRACCFKFTKLLGDKELTSYTRDDAKAFRDHLLASGLKTASVKRNMTPVRAVFRTAIAEKQLQIANIWGELSIAGLGEDATSRPSIEHADLTRLREECRSSNDDIRWMIAMQIDLGARIAEIAGLALSDIHIAGVPTPYVTFRHHPWRRLKNNQSIREVPLVGVALWAAERVLSEAENGQTLAFPRYLSEGKALNADSASATVNKWLRASGFAFTSHSFRHAMRDRLRNADAPKSVQDEVGGWGTRTEGENYGKGTWLRRLESFMVRSLDTAHGAPLESPEALQPTLA